MSTSTINLWGRAWKLSVKTVSDSGPVTNILSQESWDPEALRVTFDVLQTTLPSPFWFADITVYNLNDPTLQNLLFNAVWLTFEAGYQFGPSKSSIIWDGPVLQVLFDRPDVVNQTMRFNCVATTPVLTDAFMNVVIGPFQSQYQTVSQMIDQVGGNVNDQVSSTAQRLLSAKQYPRGKTVFGNVSKFLSQIAEDNFLAHWIAGNQHFLSDLYNPAVKVNPDLVFAPALPPGAPPANDSASITRSIVGVPIQTPFGADFTVLLDPRLVVKLPPLLVKLDQTIISQMKILYGQVLTPLDKSGLYIAAQVRHFGDTRGNDWYTTVTGYNRTYAQGLLEGTFAAAAAGTQ